MRRADRLFQIIQLLRRRRHPVTAATLAERLNVSKRTIYRDIADLSATGVPLRGEAGIGYELSKSYDLPPLMFNEEELEALALGTRVVQTWGDPELATAADTAMRKIESALPEPLWMRAQNTSIFAVNLRSSERHRNTLGALRRAMRDQRKITLDYTDGEGRASERDIRPVGLFYWGRTWTLAAWCELREDFRSFRVDRIAAFTVKDDTFADESGRTLQDLLKTYSEA